MHLQCTESQLRCHTSRTRHCVSPRSSHCGLAAQTGGPPPVIASWRRLCLPAAGDVTVVDRGQNDQSPAESFPSYAPDSALFLPPRWRTLCPSFQASDIRMVSTNFVPILFHIVSYCFNIVSSVANAFQYCFTPVPICSNMERPQPLVKQYETILQPAFQIRCSQLTAQCQGRTQVTRMGGRLAGGDSCRWRH